VEHVKTQWKVKHGGEEVTVDGTTVLKVRTLTTSRQFDIYTPWQLDRPRRAVYARLANPVIHCIAGVGISPQPRLSPWPMPVAVVVRVSFLSFLLGGPATDPTCPINANFAASWNCRVRV
jgi:hypothetical protein